MKKILTPLNEARQQSKPREPVYEYREIADRLGVLWGQLLYAQQRAPIPMPSPKLEQSGRKWYSLREMRAWWEAINGRELACSPNAERNKRYRLNRKRKSVLSGEGTIET